MQLRRQTRTRLLQAEYRKVLSSMPAVTLSPAILLSLKLLTVTVNLLPSRRNQRLLQQWTK